MDEQSIISFKYDMSVIIPAYNAEDYIEQCVTKLEEEQTYARDKYQVIVINDGSTDDTEEICYSLAKKYKNIVFISQENSGVSAARNVGIDAAEGKYIMFLDSDDSLSDNAIEMLFAFFEEHYDETKIVTYPVFNDYGGGNIVPHGRNKKFKYGNGVYDIVEHSNLLLTNIVVSIKNEPGLGFKFNESMVWSEDEEFNTRIIFSNQLKTIGYCGSIKYFYNRKNYSSATAMSSHPLYCYQMLIDYWFRLIRIYSDENGHIPRYIENIILYQFAWRFKADLLFPYHLNNYEFGKYIDNLWVIISKISPDVIRSSGDMDVYIKMHLVKLSKHSVYIEMGRSFYRVNVDGVPFASGKRTCVWLNRITDCGDEISISGSVMSPLFEYKIPKLFIHLVEKAEVHHRIKIDLGDSNDDYHNASVTSTVSYAFNVTIKKNNYEKIYFETEIDDSSFLNSYSFSRYVAINPKINYLTVKFGHFWFYYIASDKCFKLERTAFCNSVVAYIERKKSIFCSPKPFRIGVSRKVSLLYNPGPVWLYMDRKGIFDNGYYQFMHDIKIDDGIKRFYVYDDEFEFVKEKFTDSEIKHLVKYGSFKHKLLFINSDKILSSFKDDIVYNPLLGDMRYYRDLMHYELVYLQHGVLHCSAPLMYAYEKTEVGKVVVSSKFELTNFQEKYHYSRHDIICSGAPRYDFIDSDTRNNERKIVYAPTWRKYLIGGIENRTRKTLDDRFIKSNYYLRIQELLNSKELICYLEKENLQFVLKLHPIFSSYVAHFKSLSSRIQIDSNPVKLEDYSIFITDYSSYVFDYCYLNRPIIYFIPDELEFNAGLHTYRELDLPLKDAFGPITKSADELIKQIKKVVDSNFAVHEPYLSRMQNFFFEKDKEHRNRLYKELMRKN